jgi:hypothetical protein
VWGAWGRLVHSCIHYMNAGVIAGEPTPRDWRAVLQRAGDAPYNHEPIDVREATRLMAGYYARYGTANAGWPEEAQIVASEQLLGSDALPLPYTTRVDALLRLSGELIVTDHKSRAQRIPDERADFARGLATRPQFVGLSWLVKQAYGLAEPPPVWVNAIIKTKIPDYDRLLVRITQSAIDQWLENQARIAAAGLNGDLMNYSQCAPDIGQRCWAFDWCHGSAEMRSRKFTCGDAAKEADNE